MRVLITGAAGFLGQQLTKALLARGTLSDGAGQVRAIDELVLADAMPVPLPIRLPSDAGGAMKIRSEVGDLCDPAFVRRLCGDGGQGRMVGTGGSVGNAAAGIASVFHLAATLTIDAETDFARGLAVNVQALMQMLEACRGLSRPARFVFASSIAAFGGPLPDTVDDAVALTPQTSYGTHKAIVELLINDYTRHGFIDGRALRLPIVLIRPGSAAPTLSPSVSDKVAAIVREPLLGRDVDCGLEPDTRIPVASARRVAAALIAVHELPVAAFGHTRVMNLPSLTVDVGGMIQALQRCAGARPNGRIGRIRWVPDAGLQAVVDGWPKAFVSALATRHGIRADASFDEVIQAFIDDHLGPRAA